MSDLPQPEENQSKLEPPPPADVSTHSPDTSPKKPRRKLLIIGGLLLAGLCLCIWLLANLFSTVVEQFANLSSTAVEQKDDCLAVTDAFMRAMANKDPNRAYALFSTQVQDEMPVSELEAFLNGPMFALYDGYLEMEISAWELSSTLEGRFVELNGTVTCEGGYSGSFDAVLIQERDEWTLLMISFNVTIPPDKFQDYLERNNP